MAEVIARVRKEMQDRLRQLEAELAAVGALVAEKAAPGARARRATVAAAADADAGAAPARKPRRAPRPRAPGARTAPAVQAALETMPASVGELAAAWRIGIRRSTHFLRKGVERVGQDRRAGGRADGLPHRGAA